MVSIECPWCEAEIRVDLREPELQLRCEECASSWELADGPSDAIRALAAAA